MLGFRGEFIEKPEKLQSWVDGIRDRIRRAHRAELSLPADQGFTTFVPQLNGLDRFSTMVRLGAALALVSVPILVVLLMRMVSSS
jgi:hypothetical protein